MGDPRRNKKKYTPPLHPWRRERLEKERVLVNNSGLKNKKELWKFESKLRNFTRQAKNIIRHRGEKQSEKEKVQLINKLAKYNLINKDAKVEDVLNLTLENILNRRLQTIVYKNGLAKSVNQARQFIKHGHIFVNGKKINVPSYMVNAEEQGAIIFNPKSTLAKEDHPERIIVKKETVAQKSSTKEEIAEVTA